MIALLGRPDPDRRPVVRRSAHDGAGRLGPDCTVGRRRLAGPRRRRSSPGRPRRGGPLGRGRRRRPREQPPSAFAGGSRPHGPRRRCGGPADLGHAARERGGPPGRAARTGEASGTRPSGSGPAKAGGAAVAVDHPRPVTTTVSGQPFCRVCRQGRPGPVGLDEHAWCTSEVAASGCPGCRPSRAREPVVGDRANAGTPQQSSAAAKAARDGRRHAAALVVRRSQSAPRRRDAGELDRRPGRGRPLADPGGWVVEGRRTPGRSLQPRCRWTWTTAWPRRLRCSRARWSPACRWRPIGSKWTTQPSGRCGSNGCD